jgi:type IV secretion system protein VirD4
VADYRPYRTANSSAQAKLARVKRISLTVFFVAALIISWQTTQETARRFNYQPALGAPLIGHIYTPWTWISWWVRWHVYPDMEQAAFHALYPLLAVGMVVAGAIIIARKMLTDDVPDSHGSARWANDEEVRTSGLIAAISRLPRWLRRLAIRMHLMKRPPVRDGIYLGVWKPRGRGRGSYLRDCGSGHVFGYAPTRAGKGVSTIIPTLTTWRHSALIHDFKGELWEQTAGARKKMGQVCLKFNPADKEGCVKYNPLEEVRIGTDHEVADVQDIVQMLIDPEGKGFGDDHWKETAAPLFTGAIFHILYAETVKTLRGLIGFLSDPGATIDQIIERMMTAQHDPDGSMGWLTFRGEPTRTHPIVAESMREVLKKAEKERASVVSEIGKRLSIYRDPLVAAATERSDFKVKDLMNHEKPVSLYLSIPYGSRHRMKPVIRVILNQIIRGLTAELHFKNGRAVSPHKRPLLLMLDEFPVLGHFEVFSDALAVMAGFGIRACIMAQDLTQIHNVYGRAESITSNCDSRVAFTPNKLETSEELSRMIGDTTIRTGHTTASTHNVSTSESESRRPLMTPDEVRRLPIDEGLIFTRGRHPIRAKLLLYYQEPYFRQLSEIPAPAKSDRIITAPPPVAGKSASTPESPVLVRAGSPRPVAVKPANPAPPLTAQRKVSFLKYAANGSTKK